MNCAADDRKGFTLVELILVIAILATVFTIAVPMLAASKMSANETAAIQYARTWIHSQEQYKIPNGVYGRPSEINDAGIVQVDNPPADAFDDLTIGASQADSYSILTDTDSSDPLVAASEATMDNYGYIGYLWYGELNSAASAWVLHGVPQTYGVTGARTVYVDSAGDIRVMDHGGGGSTPASDDPGLGR